LADTLIALSGVGVRYGTHWALRDLSFEVRSGEVVALLGPNGAGKTTTMSVLAALRPPHAGVAYVGGHDVARADRTLRAMIGLVPQRLAIYPTLSAAENCTFFARAAGLRGSRVREAVDRVLAVVGLVDRRAARADTFSGGMLRRLNLACGILHRPRVLLLDEATVGVDPQSRERIQAAVRNEAQSGAAVLWSTHAIDEAERLCDRVVLIDGGRVVADGAPDELVRAARAGLRVVVTTRLALAPDWAAGLAGIEIDATGATDDTGDRAGHRVRLRATDASTAARAVERIAVGGAGLVAVEMRPADLEDVFLELTGRGLRD